MNNTKSVNNSNKKGFKRHMDSQQF